MTASVLVVALLAPPPIHNHIGPRAAVESYIAHRCTAGEASPHLHSARTVTAPYCPACAAGPAAVGALARAELAATVAVNRLSPPPPAGAPLAWTPLHGSARAPPLPSPGR